jgi:hypothetical protein
MTRPRPSGTTRVRHEAGRLWPSISGELMDSGERLAGELEEEGWQISGK